MWVPKSGESPLPTSADSYLHLGHHRGVFETVHGIGENIRGRTLEAMDDVTKSGTPESKSRYATMADRGRMEAETGIARIHGHPDPHAGKAFDNKPGSLPQPTTGIPGSGHTTGTGPGTGYTGEQDYYRGGGGVGTGVGKVAGGYGTDDGYGPPGVRNPEHQQPAIDRSTGVGPHPDERVSQPPNRTFQNAGPEMDGSSRPQAGAPIPPQQRVGPDAPLEPLRRPQAQATGDDQHGQMYQ